jgi:gliding motility-associated-like protein/CSLREA domain-containing protein
MNKYLKVVFFMLIRVNNFVFDWYQSYHKVNSFLWQERRCLFKNSIKIKRLAICLLVLISFSSMVNAQNYTVTTINDTQDANLGDGLCNDGTGSCSLRAAIMESNALGGNHTITLPAGTYGFTINGIGEDLSATGDLDINSNISLVGASAFTTIINADSLDRVFHVLPGNTVDISFVTIKEGYAFPGNGGGVLNEGNLTISEVHISNNTCELNQGGTLIAGFGGGISNEGTLTAAQVTLFNNTARGGRGINGANGGGGGGSTPGFGGGIYNGASGSINLLNCTISGNSAIGGMSSGGSANNGIFNFVGNNGGGPNGGTGGTAGGGAGGNATGVYSGGGGGGSSGNFGGTGGLGGYGGGGGGRGARSGSGTSGAGGLGGFGGGQGSGPCCSSGGGGGAGAGLGGGLFNNGGTITTTNVTIAFNTAQGGRGAFLNPLSGYAAAGTDGEGFGGGIFNRSGTINLNNTLVSNNTNVNDVANATPLGTASDEDLYGTVTSTSGFNLVFNPGAGVIGGNTAGNVLNADPGLLALSNNGGTTFTHALTTCPPGPAINAANDLVAPPLDQRDSIRNGVADIGAFEAGLSNDIFFVYSIVAPCENQTNGSIVVTPTGTPTFTYQWDVAAGSQTDSLAINLGAGMYLISIMDGNGCVKDTVFTLVAIPSPNIDLLADQTVCDSYTLPTITGTTLSGNEAYYDAPNGGGNQFLPGAIITATTTLYIYDETGTVPNCFDEELVTITISNTPDVDLMLDQVACDSYSLPVITGTNLSGNEAYYDQPNAGGNQYVAGALITTTTTLYIYDVVGAVNCFDQESFTITITSSPDIDSLISQSYCDSHTLPAITGLNLSGNEAYYDTPNGGGVQYLPGAVITNTITLYIYDETGTVPNCFDEELVTITISNTPDVDLMADQVACDSYSLPVITGTNLSGNEAYYDAPNAVGNQYVAGALITTTTVLYIYDSAALGICYDEVTFTVTINTTPVMNPMNDETVCHGDQIIIPAFASNGPNTVFNWVNTSGIDIGFGLNGSGSIPQSTADNLTGAPITITIEVTPVSLEGCVGSPVFFDVIINPIPVVSFIGDQLSGCAPLLVNFTNTVDVGLSCVWDFGDGTSGNVCANVSTDYLEPGTYDVTLTVTSLEGCVGSFTAINYINVVPYPIASFSVNTTFISGDNQSVNFTNTSLYASSYEWNMENGEISILEDILYTFDITSSNEVMLIAYNIFGCSDTAYLTIEIQEELIYFVPNAFTPDGNEFNQTFQPVFASGFDPFDFQLLIYDRWGQLIFESRYDQIGWDGTFNGKLVQDGTYIWTILFKDRINDSRYRANGHVTVLK